VKIRPVGARVVPCGRTERHDEASIHLFLVWRTPPLLPERCRSADSLHCWLVATAITFRSRLLAQNTGTDSSSCRSGGRYCLQLRCLKYCIWYPATV